MLYFQGKFLQKQEWKL